MTTTLTGRDWQGLLDRLVAEVPAPGAVLGILERGASRVFAAGLASLSTNIAMTTDTLFPIASITKVFTATLAMQLVDEGRLELDRPIREYLPEFRVADPDATKTLTPWHLLTHSSGLGGDKDDDFGRGDDALARYVTDCAGLPQVHPPGDTVSYCNSGFNILGHLVAVLRGTTWDQAMAEQLLRPLRLTRSGTLPEHVIWSRFATGHQTTGRDQVEPLHVWETSRSSGPCGGVVTSAADLLHFAAMHLSSGLSDTGSTVLSPESVRSMATPQLELANDYVGSTHWGLGWALELRADQPLIISHGGDLLGHHCRLLVCPDRGLAAVLLVNGDGAESLDRATFDAILEAVGVVRPDPPCPPASPPNVDLGHVSGTYETMAVRATLVPVDARIDATFEIIDPRLAALMPASQREQRASLIPVTPTLFVTRDTGAADEPWSPVVFTDTGANRYLHLGVRAFRKT